MCMDVFQISMGKYWMKNMKWNSHRDWNRDMTGPVDLHHVNRCMVSCGCSNEKTWEQSLVR